MSTPKLFDEMSCIVQTVHGLGFYEVMVKDHGMIGLLLCPRVPPLVIGQEFSAEFIGFDAQGKYLLQRVKHERNSDGELLLKPEFEPPTIPGAGKLIPFPKRRNET